MKKPINRLLHTAVLSALLGAMYPVMQQMMHLDSISVRKLL